MSDWISRKAVTTNLRIKSSKLRAKIQQIALFYLTVREMKETGWGSP